MRIRTAIFGVYVVASAVGFAAIMALVLRDVRLRYVESMRRTMGDTAAYMAAFAICLLFFLIAAGVMLWTSKLGRLEGLEDTKYKMLDD